MSVRRLNILIWCLPWVLFFVLAWQYFAPTGTRTINYTMGETSPYVQRLLPDTRVSELREQAGDQYLTLLDEPVYFSVTPPPGNYASLQVDVQFDPGGTPILELGGLKDIAAQAFDFRPLANTLLEELSWTRHELTNDQAIFTRDSKVKVDTDFFIQPPDRSLVATYRTSFPTPYREPGYTPIAREQVFDVSLRGPHELLTYIKSEEFSFSVSYHDVNRTYGSDEGYIKVFNEAGELMLEQQILDDGNIYDNQEPGVAQVFTLTGKAWPEGVYRIVLSGTSDSVWRSLVTRQRYLVVKNRIFIADDVGYLPQPRATSVFTQAPRLTFETSHREGLQLVTANNQSIFIDQVGAKYTRDIAGDGVYEMRSPVGDIKVTGDGKYAFSREAFFDPDPISLTAFTHLEDTPAEYVLATLAPVRYTDAWRVAGTTFQTTDLVMENGAYKFALSAPGIQDNLGQVKIHKLQVRFMKANGAGVSWSEVKHFLRFLLP
jgi:hypothetical protein